MPQMKEVARLRFQYMLVTCEVAEDASSATVRCVNVGIMPGNVGHFISERTTEVVARGDGAPALFNEACIEALSLYTRGEWRDGLENAGVDI